MAEFFCVCQTMSPTVNSRVQLWFWHLNVACCMHPCLVHLLVTRPTTQVSNWFLHFLHNQIYFSFMRKNINWSQLFVHPNFKAWKKLFPILGHINVRDVDNQWVSRVTCCYWFLKVFSFEKFPRCIFINSTKCFFQFLLFLSREPTDQLLRWPACARQQNLFETNHVFSPLTHHVQPSSFQPVTPPSFCLASNSAYDTNLKRQV